MKIKDKVNAVFENNLIIARQLGDKNIISIIEGIQKEINDLFGGISE